MQPAKVLDTKMTTHHARVCRTRASDNSLCILHGSWMMFLISIIIMLPVMIYRAGCAHAESVDALYIALPCAAIDNIAAQTGIDPHYVSLLDCFGTRDATLAQIGHLLLAELQFPGVGSRLMFDTLTSTCFSFALTFWQPQPGCSADSFRMCSTTSGGVYGCVFWMGGRSRSPSMPLCSPHCISSAQESAGWAAKLVL
jgi:hypothetical protein